MNNTYDFNRFSLLVKRQWVENRKLFLMASIIILGSIIGFYGFNLDIITGNLFNAKSRMIFSIGVFFLVGTFFTNYILKDFSNKNDSISFLLIPASHFDKLLSSLLYIFIVFPIVYSLLFHLIDFSFVNIGNNIMNNYDAKSNVEGNEMVVTYMMDSDNLEIGIITGIWLMVQSFVIVGSTNFEGWAYIKTGFAGLVLFLSIYLITGAAVEILVTDLSHQVAINSNSYSQIKPTKEMLSDITLIALKYAFTPILLLIAYFKLKEKQV